MVDITPKIKDAIRRAHANSWYAYPADWSSFPVCAFYLAGHGDYARADGREYLARVAYQVDVWAGTPEEVAPSIRQDRRRAYRDWDAARERYGSV